MSPGITATPPHDTGVCRSPAAWPVTLAAGSRTGGEDGKIGGQAFVEITQATVGYQTGNTAHFQAFNQDITDHRNIRAPAPVDDQNGAGRRFVDPKAWCKIGSGQHLRRR